MKIAVLFDDVASRPGATPDERGVLEAVEAVGEALEAEGHRVAMVPAAAELAEWRGRLVNAAPDLVFNLCEGLGGLSEGEVLAARVLEELSLPFTGSGSSAMSLVRQKDRANELLHARGLPIPAWGLWDGFNREAWAAEWSAFPAIVKPAAEDASVGITQDSVVTDQESLARRLGEMGALAPLLVQAFVGTREVYVGIVGHEVLPLSEIVFDDLPPGHRPIVGYDAKWSPGSPDDRGTRPVCPAPLGPEEAQRATELALEAWRVLEGEGYGRVDFRLSADGALHLLEVNPNPDLAPSAGLARMARARGWGYQELIRRIVEAASVLSPSSAGAVSSSSAGAREGAS